MTQSRSSQSSLLPEPHCEDREASSGAPGYWEWSRRATPLSGTYNPWEPVWFLIRGICHGHCSQKLPLSHGVALNAGAEIDRDLIFLAIALWMSEPGRAFSVGADVVDDGVLHVRTDACRDVIQSEKMPQPPGHVVIGAGAVAADADGAGKSITIIQRKPAPEHDDPAEMLADQRVLRAAVLGGLPGIERLGVGRAAEPRAEQISAGLRLGVEIGGGHRLVAETEGVCGVCLFGGDGAASRPLLVRLVAAEGDRADDAVAIDHGRPFVVVEAAVAGTAAGLDALLQDIGEPVMIDRTRHPARIGG